MAEAFETRTSKNLINRLRTSKRIGNSSRKQNLRKPQMHQSLRGSTVANYFKLSLAGTSTIYYIVSSPREPRFVLVPIRFASEAWPRPGLALETGPLSSTEQKGKDCHDRDKQVQGAGFWVRFWHLKLICFLETELGPPLLCCLAGSDAFEVF